jgi:hypothetical protein
MERMQKEDDSCLEELRTATKILIQYSRSPGGDLKPGPPEYEEKVLPT